MTDSRPEGDPATAPSTDRASAKKRMMTRVRIGLIGIGAVFVLLQVIATENRVRDLQSRGFSDFVIESTRNHAYFPIIGAVIGAVMFSLIFTAIKRAIHKSRK